MKIGLTLRLFGIPGQDWADFVAKVIWKPLPNLIPSRRRGHLRDMAMMGRLNRDQGQLFCCFNLEEVVPEDHQVRRIAEVLDLSWVHAEAGRTAAARKAGCLRCVSVA
jgi:hypothetical protein